MSDTPSPGQSAREEEMSLILAAFLEAVAMGQTPDRELLFAAYPEHAHELRSFFADHDRMKEAAGIVQQEAPKNDFSSSNQKNQLSEEMLQPFGDYELLEEIGRGGMGIVYKARQVSLNRIVALKRIRAGQLASAEDIARFQSEAKAAAGLDHPHIVPIYEVGEHQGQHYFTMKLIEGGNLNANVERFHSDPTAIARIMTEVSRAVHHAHQRGILHRDIKPSNTLLDAEGKAHVSDFGLAKQLEEDGKLTRSGAIVGTPEYMAPEQARGDKGLTTSADVYGLGAVLYFLLTRQPPFQGDYDWEVLKQVVEDDPKTPRSLHRLANRDLETVCLKCLYKEAARRYGSADELAQDLERCQRGETPLARPASRWERFRQWIRKHPTWAAVIAVLLLATTALLVSGLYFNWRLQEEIDAVSSAGAQLQGARQSVASTQKMLDQAIADAGEEKKKAASITEDFRATKMAGQLRLAADALSRNSSLAFDLLHDYEKCPVDLRDTTWHLLHNACMDTRSIEMLPPLDYAPDMVFSPDRKRLAAFGWKPDAKHFLLMHDLVTGTQIRRDGDVKRYTTAAAFSPDRKTLALGVRELHKGEHFRIEVWDAVALEMVRIVKVTDAPVASVAFSPDGKWLAAGLTGADFYRFEIGEKGKEWEETRDTLFELAKDIPDREIPKQDVVVAFTSDSKQLAAVAQVERGFKVKMKYADVPEKDRRDKHFGHRLELHVRVQPLARDAKPQTHISFDEIKHVRMPHRLPPRLAIAGDSRTMAVTFGRQVAFLYDLEPLKQRRGLIYASKDGSPSHNGEEHPYWHDIALNHDGSLLAAVQIEGPDHSAGYVGVWDVQTSRYRGPLDMDLPPRIGFWLDGPGIRTRLAFDGPATLHAVATEMPLSHLLFGLPARKTTWQLRGNVGKQLPGPGSAALALSPDGATLASANGTAIQLCTFLDGKASGKLEIHKERITCLAFSHDGKKLVSGDASGTVLLWDLEGKKVIQTLTGPKALINNVLFTRDDEYVIATSDHRGRTEYRSLMWLARTGVLVADPGFNDIGQVFYAGEELRFHNSPSAVAVHPKLNRIATADYDRCSLRVTIAEIPKSSWSEQSGIYRSSAALAGRVADVEGLRFSADGKRIVAWTRVEFLVGEVSDIHAPKQVASYLLPEGNITSAVLDGTGRTVIAATTDGNLHFYNVERQMEQAVLRLFSAPVLTLVLSSDGRTLLAAGADGTVRYLRLDPATPQVTFRASEGWASFDREGKLVRFAKKNNGDGLRVMDVDSGAILADSKKVLTDPFTPTQFPKPDLTKGPKDFFKPGIGLSERRDFFMSPLLADTESFHVACTEFPEGRHRIQFERWNLRTGHGNVLLDSEAMHPKGKFRAIGWAFSPDGTVLVLYGVKEALAIEQDENQVHILDTRSGKNHAVSVPHYVLARGHFSSSGKLFFLSSRDPRPVNHGAIPCYPVCHGEYDNSRDGRVVDMETHQLISHPSPLRLSGALDPQGRLLVLGDPNKRSRIILWDFRTKKEAAVLEHSARVDLAGFSHDGHRLITRCGNRIWVWNVPRPEGKD